MERVRVVTSTLSDAYVGNLDGINRKTKPRSMACPRCIGGRIIGNDPSCANCGYDADTSTFAADEAAAFWDALRGGKSRVRAPRSGGMKM